MDRAQKLESHSWLQNLCNPRNLCETKITPRQPESRPNFSEANCQFIVVGSLKVPDEDGDCRTLV